MRLWPRQKRPRRTWTPAPKKSEAQPGFDFNGAMYRLVGGILDSVGEFSRISHPSIQISASFNRSRSKHGLLAYVVPMKYRGGAPVEVRTRGKKAYHWAMLPEFEGDQEVLYRIYFLLPRFLNLSYRDKVETVVHELYHIHPDGNGDLRRFPGKAHLHGDGDQFDQRVRVMTDEFLDSPQAASLTEFLIGSESALIEQHGQVLARRLPEPRPRLLKVVRVP